MIDSLTGQLVDVQDGRVVLERSGVGFVVSIPGYAVGELARHRDREVTLHTLLFIEGAQNGGHLEPQLVGFPDAGDKVFFRRFISVKGVGWRKALKALTEPVAHVATWIEQGDAKALKRLPGIGARAAELIVAELKGKMEDLAIATRERAAGGGDGLSDIQRDAIEIMVALGDGRIEAERWLEQVRDADAATPEDWVRAAYRVKAGVKA